MRIFELVLIIGILLRTVLDLTSLRRAIPSANKLYAVIYGISGGVIIMVDHDDVFGYMILVAALIYSICIIKAR
jgi:hypothetical protein